MQRGSRIEGSHQGDFVTRDLGGSIDGNVVRVASNYPESNGDALTYTFSGQATADEMSGNLEMGEYRAARWTAKRRVRGKE